MTTFLGKLLALLLATALLLTGCGGDSDDGGGGDGSSAAGDSGDSGDSGGDDSGDDGPFDVCGLLATSDIEAVFGGPWDDGEATHMEQTGGDQCIWGNSDPPPVKQFSAVVYREGHLSEGFEGAGVTVESLYEDTKELMQDIEELDLGDDSYLSGSSIHVLDGDTSYEFSTVLGTSPEAIKGLRELAEKALG